MSLRKFSFLRQDPLFGFAFLFALGYSGFIVYHFDAGPRYFAVLVLPVMILVVLLLEALRLSLPAAFKTLAALVLLSVVVNLAYIAKHLAQPTYSLRDASLQIRRQIEADPAATPLVIGHGAVETTWFTHIPALDDFGSMDWDRKIGLYHPGWVVTWSDNNDLLRSPEVAQRYAFIEKGKYKVFDDPNRQYLLLYRIQAK